MTKLTHIYPDWWREPLSPLEQTWRLPCLFNELRELIQKKIFIKIPGNFYQIQNGWLYIRTDWFKILLQPGTPIAFIKIIAGIHHAISDWQNSILPSYQKLLNTWRDESLNDKNNQALWNFANQVIKQDCYYTAAIIYVGIYSFIFEWLVKKICPQDNYHALLAGFPNKSFEINQELFKLAQIKQRFPEQFDIKLQNFIINYGIKKSDFELAEPCLGENLAQINLFIDLYSSQPNLDPAKKLNDLANQRTQQGKSIKNPVFKWILKWAWEYVPLRETRQFYAGAGGYYARQALNLLGHRLGLADNMIFYLQKVEIEHLLAEKMTLSQAIDIAQKKIALREQQKKL